MACYAQRGRHGEEEPEVAEDEFVGRRRGEFVALPVDGADPEAFRLEARPMALL